MPKNYPSNAEKSEALFETIRTKVEDLGMKVNPTKTQMLCINAAINAEVKSFIRCKGKSISSRNELKVLEFTFGHHPNVETHVCSLKKN